MSKRFHASNGTYCCRFSKKLRPIVNACCCAPGLKAWSPIRSAFGWFVRNRLFPLKEVNWKPETAKVQKLIIRKGLFEMFDGIPLENFDRFTLQLHLNQLAKTRSKDRVLQIKSYVRDIFTEAVEQDFLTKDPARKVTVPSQLRTRDRTTLTWEQLFLHPMPSSFPARKVGLWTPAIIENGCYISWHETSGCPS